MKNDNIVKVCLVSPMPPPLGGISRWTLLMQQYANCQQNIKLMHVNTANRWRRIDDLAIWKRVMGGGIQLLLDYFSYILALMKKPDVTHLTTSGGIGAIRDVVFFLTSRLLRVPIVYHIRFGRIPEIASKKTMEWRIITIALRLSNIVIAIDKSTFAAISFHLPSINVTYLPNPIDFSRLPLAEKNPIEQNYVLFLGWVIPTKGVAELVAAWAALAPQTWRLLLAGPGDKSYKQELITRYNPKNIEFIGEIAHDDAMRSMAQCSIFVLPSYTEGFPNAVLEAMAMGKPIIASSVGAIPDMLSEDCGIIVRPKNIDEIRNALALLIQNENLRSSLGENARKKARGKYSVEVVFASYTDIWQNLTVK